MTNDTSKLDGALMELGDTMADNLVAMGVTGASASDGLTTLANNILDIAPSVGGITPTVSIDLSKSPTLICRGATVDIMALVHADYDDTSQTDVDLKGYLQGATVTFKNGNTGIGYAVSDNDGIATLTINDIAMGNYSIVGSFDGTGTDYESATSSALAFTVNDYPTLTLSADKTTVNVGETVTFTITAMYNNTPVVGYPIQLYKDGSSMGSSYRDITNNNGECSITYTIPNDAVNMSINANTLSNNVSITILHYLYYDDCSTDRTSDYAQPTTILFSNNATITYDSTNKYYIVTKTTDNGLVNLPISILTGETDILFTFDMMIPSSQSTAVNAGAGVGIVAFAQLGGGNANNTSNIYYNRDQLSSEHGHYDGEWIHHEFTITSTGISWVAKRQNDTTIINRSQSYSIQSNTPIGLSIGYGTDAVAYFKNITAMRIE